jgi:hypothetical protein
MCLLDGFKVERVNSPPSERREGYVDFFQYYFFPPTTSKVTPALLYSSLI